MEPSTEAAKLSLGAIPVYDDFLRRLYRANTSAKVSREARSPASTPPEGIQSTVWAVRQRPTPTQARSRLVKGEDGPSDSALAAARGGRLRRPAADRHAARCASQALCSGVRPLALYALEGGVPR